MFPDNKLTVQIYYFITKLSAFLIVLQKKKIKKPLMRLLEP
jgi:hypothetical protein